MPGIRPGDQRQYRPFPLTTLPCPIRAFVEQAARSMQCDPAYVALPVLACCGAAIGNTRRLRLKVGYDVPPVLWTTVVSDSGTAKSPAYRLALQPIHQLQSSALAACREQRSDYETALIVYKRDLSAWKSSKDEWRPPPETPVEPIAKRFMVSDTTVAALIPLLASNPRGLLLARDELSGWLTDNRGVGSSSWLSMYDADDVCVDRKTGHPKTVSAEQAAVSVTGGIQPKTLRRALSQKLRDSGFAARLLFAWPPRNSQSWPDDEIDGDQEAEYHRIVQRLYEFEAQVDESGKASPSVVTLTPIAKTAFTTYFNQQCSEIDDATDEVAAALSKLRAIPARLALVVHCIRQVADDSDVNDPTVVDDRSMQAAIEMTEWFKHEARRVYAMLDETESDQNARQLVEWIRVRGGAVSSREVTQGNRRYKSVDHAEAALRGLVKSGYGTLVVENTGRPGRPPTRFHLTPLSTETTNVREIGNSVDTEAA